jgi:hypothetical protein
LQKKNENKLDLDNSDLITATTATSTQASKSCKESSQSSSAIGGNKKQQCEKIKKTSDSKPKYSSFSTEQLQALCNKRDIEFKKTYKDSH